jgi:hypothetical protein
MCKKILTVLIAVITMAGAAQAAVIVADGFDYTPQQQLAGLNGGYSMDANNNWSSAWRDGTDFTTYGVHLPKFEATGASTMGTQTTAGGIPGVILGVERQVAENQATDTYYFGFDIKYFANSGSAAVASLFGLLIDRPGDAALDVFALAFVADAANNGGTQWLIHGNVVSGGITGPSTYAADVFHRMVGRLTFNKNDGGTTEELVLWVDPLLETDAPAVTHIGQDIGDSPDGMVMGIWGRDIYGDPGWEGDDLNLVTTFAEARDGVIPEPATLSVLVLGALVGLLRKSR